MKTLTVKVPADLSAELASAAQQRGRSKSSLVREAIAAYVRGGDQRRSEMSCYDLARDLAGCFDGPVDLGREAERYLKGFGR